VQGNLELAERFLEEEAAQVGGAETILRAGNAPAIILELIDELSPSLVVMGTHGRGGIARLALGSVAEQVVRQAPVPVMTVSALANAARRSHAA
jgi:nucleotide-binding universal stress UspA family protein